MLVPQLKEVEETMSTRSRSEKKYFRSMDTATTWVLGGRPKLRRKGLAWFARHHLKAPNYSRKPRKAKSVAEQPLVLGNLPIHYTDMRCACGSTVFERSTSHRGIEDSHWQVVHCERCGKVYRQKVEAPMPTLMSLTKIYAGERCPLCNHSSFSRSAAHATIETPIWQVVICSHCDEVFREKAPPQWERQIEPVRFVDGDEGPGWHGRRDGRSIDKSGWHRDW